MMRKNIFTQRVKESRFTPSTDSRATLYWVFACLRIILVFVPQTGYIHPDEYFQSIEIASGDSFDIDVNKPWEFNVTFPVRTAMFPCLFVYFPYSILKVLSPYCDHFLGQSLKMPYFLVIFPRLLMCILSFISDHCLYKICQLANQRCTERLIIFASSYVTMIYATHTFSNSVELLLMSLLLYYVSRCMAFSNKVVMQSDNLCEHYNRATTGVERARYYKLRMSLPEHSLNDCAIIATITVIGIFNRPTFVAFACAPIFFWLQRGLGSRSVGLLDFHIRIVVFVACSLPALILFIVCDSYYFGYLTTAEILNLELGINNFVVTPLNFIKYNLIIDNLKTHGLHPRVLHFLVNVPLLFNILGIFGLVRFGKMVYRCLLGRWLELPRIQSLESLMTASFVTPIALLSLIPHQEPRFIIPTLLPLVYLCANDVWHSSTAVEVLDRSRTQSGLQRKRLSKQLRIWYISNIILTLFYGFLHQGGVLPLMSHLATELRAKPHLTHVHLITSHTYLLPTALLHLRNSRKVYVNSEKRKYMLVKDFYPTELGSRNISSVYESIVAELTKCEQKFVTKKIPYRLYYVLPASLYQEFGDYVLKNDTQAFEYKVAKTFYPHATIEKLPSPRGLWQCLILSQRNCAASLMENITDNVFRYLRQFGLLLLKIEVVK